MSDSTRGEVTVNIGKEDRVLHFRTAEIMQLEKMLDCDVTTWMQKGGSELSFCVYAIMAGLSRSGMAKKLSLGRVQAWLDDFPQDGSLGELYKKLLQAIARGKPGEEGLELAKVIDEMTIRRDKKEVPTDAG